MYIIITCGNLRSGGAERVISILANDFVSKGHDVCIYTWLNTEVFYQFNERVNICQIPLNSRQKGKCGQMIWFRKMIIKEKPDVILGFLAPYNILTRFSTIGINIPVLLAERNDPLIVSSSYNGLWRIVRNIAYSLATGILVQTGVNKSHFPKYLQCKSTIIYNPVLFSPDKIGLALKSKKRHEIVSVTRLQKQKNVSMLIDAFSEFYKTHPQYKLIIYGEGSERASLEEMIREKNLMDVVSLPGRKTNVHELIVGAEIFAMASDYEGMSNSLIEAMCLGLPCISTKVSGATDLIKDGYNGRLIDVKDKSALISALIELADNEDKRFLYGKNQQNSIKC